MSTLGARCFADQLLSALRRRGRTPLLLREELASESPSTSIALDGVPSSAWCLYPVYRLHAHVLVLQCAVVPPVPVSNTVVKRRSADTTARATLWEDRPVPGLLLRLPSGSLCCVLGEWILLAVWPPARSCARGLPSRTSTLTRLASLCRVSRSSDPARRAPCP